MKNFELMRFIRANYPLRTRPWDEAYIEHNGYRKLREESFSKMGHPIGRSWQAMWAKISTKLEPQGVTAQDMTNEMFPCFSGSVLLHSEKTQSLQYERELHFHVSIVAPYFCIYGVDKVYLSTVERSLNPVIFVSPMSIYEHLFAQVASWIASEMTGYVFLPFSVLEQRIPELELCNAPTHFFGTSVFQAFFTPEDIPDYENIGDSDYTPGVSDDGDCINPAIEWTRI